jgi:hypothetical protein
MTTWHSPQFEEIRMDAEINCYCSVRQDLGAVASAHPSDADAPSVQGPEARASS